MTIKKEGRMRFYQSLIELEQDSLLVPKGTISVSPEGEEEIDIAWARFHKWQYCVNNAVIGFVDYKGRLYVIPCTHKARIFFQGRFAKGNFPVPFSDFSYPKAHKELWAGLLKKAYIENIKWKEGIFDD